MCGDRRAAAAAMMERVIMTRRTLARRGCIGKTKRATLFRSVNFALSFPAHTAHSATIGLAGCILSRACPRQLVRGPLCFRMPIQMANGRDGSVRGASFVWRAEIIMQAGIRLHGSCVARD